MKMTGATAEVEITKLKALLLRLKPGQHGRLRLIAQKMKRVFRRKKRVPGTNLKVTTPHVDGAQFDGQTSQSCSDKRCEC